MREGEPSLSTAITAISRAAAAFALSLVLLGSWAPSPRSAQASILVILPLSQKRARENIDQYVAAVRATSSSNVEVIALELSVFLQHSPPADATLPFDPQKVRLIVGPPDSGDALKLKNGATAADSLLRRIPKTTPILFASVTSTQLQDLSQSAAQEAFGHPVIFAVDSNERIAQRIAEAMTAADAPLSRYEHISICYNRDSEADAYAGDLYRHLLQDLGAGTLNEAALDSAGCVSLILERIPEPHAVPTRVVPRPTECVQVFIGTTTWFQHFESAPIRCDNVVLSDAATSGAVLDEFSKLSKAAVWEILPKLPAKRPPNPKWYWGNVVDAALREGWIDMRFDADRLKSFPLAFELSPRGRQ